MSIKPLQGLIVVALEQAVAAPYCTSKLADAGARVIKIERPEGDFARGYDTAVHGESSYFVWINRGKESIALDLRLDGGGDRLALRLDSEPRRDRFDIGLDLVAPANGLVPALTGLRQPIEAHISGNGGWKRWAGTGTLDLSGQAAARLRLAVEDGEFQLGGTLKPADFLKGRFQRLSAPRIIVSGRGRVEGRAIEGQLRVSSESVRAAASGGYDLATAQYRKLRLGVDLLRPAALLDNLRGRDIRLLWTLDGPAARADYAYRLTATELRFDQTGFQRVRAEGRGKLSPWPMKVPLRLTARSISGVGDEAGAILASRPRGRLIAPQLMEAAYSRLLDRMLVQGWQLPRKRVRVSKPMLLLTLLRCSLLR